MLRIADISSEMPPFIGNGAPVTLDPAPRGVTGTIRACPRQQTAYFTYVLRTYNHIRAVGLFALLAPLYGDWPPIVTVARYFGFLVDYPDGADFVS
jgi:hypothetical protein